MVGAAGEQYRARALELLAHADKATDTAARLKFENMAAAFWRLACQVESNEGLIIDFVAMPPEHKQPKS